MAKGVDPCEPGMGTGKSNSGSGTSKNSGNHTDIPVDVGSKSKGSTSAWKGDLTAHWPGLPKSGGGVADCEPEL